MRMGPEVWVPGADALMIDLPDPCLPRLPHLCHCLTPTGRLDGRTMWVGIVLCRVPQRILTSVWQAGLVLVPLGSCVVPLDFVDGCWLWCCPVGAALGFLWCVVGWPRKNGRIAGTPLGFVPLVAARRMRCSICCLPRRCSAVAAGVHRDVALGQQ